MVKVAAVASNNGRTSPPLRRRTTIARASFPRFLLFFGVASILVAVLRLVDGTSDVLRRADSVTKSSPPESEAKLVRWEPTHPLKPKGMVLKNVELFYMIPFDQATVGVLVFFHGCTHGGYDMFALPEDRVVAKLALNRGMAVLSPTSLDRSSGCWSSHDKMRFQEANLMEAWMTAVELSPSLPVVAMGASSGGSFVFDIHDTIQAKAIASYISAGFFEGSEDATHWPATAYVHMTRDTRTTQYIQRYRQPKLEKKDIPHQVFTVEPHSLTPTLCAHRLPELGIDACQKLLGSIPQILMNPETYEVQRSYLGGVWDSALVRAGFDGTISQETATRGKEHPNAFSGHVWIWAGLEEEIAAAYAMHEMVCEHAPEVLDFLMHHAGIQGTLTKQQQQPPK